MTALESAPSDEALAVRAQQGERQAFDLLIHRHKSALYRIVRRYVGDADEAYDLLQDALVSVWEGLDRYDARRSFLAWTHVVALNKCRDFSRRRRIRRLMLETFAADPIATASTDPTELDETHFVSMQQEQRLRRLEAAIAALPPLYKEPLLLTTAGGLSHESAAEVLKTTSKAIEMRLRRARAKLRQAFGPPEG